MRREEREEVNIMKVRMIEFSVESIRKPREWDINVKRESIGLGE